MSLMRGMSRGWLLLTLLAHLVVVSISAATGPKSVSQSVSVKQYQDNYALLIRSDVLEDLGYSFAEKEALRKEVAAICDPFGVRVEGENIEVDPSQYHPKDHPVLVKAIQEKVVDKLPSEKKERLGEIKLQVNGERCFLEKEVIQKLGLTEADLDSIKKAFQEADREITELAMEYFPRFTDEAVKRMKKLEKSHREIVRKLLDPTKQAAWEKLKGKVFKAKESELSFGR